MTTTRLGLAIRRREPEEMDAPGLEPERHAEALSGLARINAVSSVAAALAAVLARVPGARRLRVLDVATGGADVPIGLWRTCRERGLELDIVACDTSPFALSWAAERARAAGAPISFRRLDVLTDDLPDGFDAVISTLFLHHLEDAEAARMLVRFAQAAGRVVVVSDLVRSRAGLALAWLGTRALSRSEVVRADGLRSVRAAFTMAEARALAARAGLAGARVERRWPCRLQLTWWRR